MLLAGLMMCWLLHMPLLLSFSMLLVLLLATGRPECIRPLLVTVQCWDHLIGCCLLLHHVVLLCWLLYLLHVDGCSTWGHPLLHVLKLLLMNLCWRAAADLDWNLITMKCMRHDIDTQLHWQLLQLLLGINTRRHILLHANSRPSALQASFNIGTLQESFVHY